VADAATGSIIAQVLARAGAPPLFTLNGGHIWALYAGALEQGLRLIDVRHEQTAGFAAEGWARLTRGVGVAAVTAGPGVTNTISPLAQARQNDSPLLVIGGRAPMARWGMGSLQELDQLPIVSSLTKSARTLESAERAQELAEEAVRMALTPRTGPTFLDVPLDVFLSVGDVETGADLGPAPGAAPDPSEVERALALLSGAARPALVAGNGVWWSGAEQELRRLAEALDAPVVLNGMARGMLPPHHRLFASRARSRALGGADVILVAGAELDFRLGFGQPPLFPEDAQVIYVDTDDRHKHRRPGAALYGDVRLALRALADGLGTTRRDPEWSAGIAAAAAQAAERDAALAASAGSPVHPARLVAEVGRAVADDAILVGDGGDFVSFAGRLLHRSRPGLWLDPGPYGCLGAGPGYALAAKVLHPDRQVILLSGDGAFGFAGMEFDTFLRHRLPVVCVIGNDGIWALEKHPMEDMMGTSIVTDLRPGTRYDEVVRALGGHGELVRTAEEIGPAVRRALDSGLPACVNVLCDPDARYPRSAQLA
jgi:acetolactate synthase-1/2/3 large subunit